MKIAKESRLFNLGSEAALLHAVIKKPAIVTQFNGHFRPDLFADKQNAVLAVTLIEEARKPGATNTTMLEAIAQEIAAEKITQEDANVILHTPVGNAELHLATLIELRLHRALADACRDGLEAIEAGGLTCAKAYKRVMENLAAVAETAPSVIEGRAELSRGVPVLTTMADIEPRDVEWLWHNRIPKGRITLFVGLPGEGKSFCTTDMAARITTGENWPDGAPCPHGSVILVSGEDDPADTIRPRLDAHGADVSRVHLLSGIKLQGEDGKEKEICFTLQHLPALEMALQTHRDCQLVVIDPIGSYLGGDTDSHRDNEVRGVLAPLAALAEKYGAAVLIVAHRRKSTGTRADDLALGSRAFTGIARASWHLSRDPANKDRRLFLAGKNNLAKEGEGLAFTIQGHPARLLWEASPVAMNADEGLAAESLHADSPGPKPEARTAAGDWLREVLSIGDVAAADVRSQATEAGMNFRTVQRAADEIGVIRKKEAFGGGWRWSLPEGDKVTTGVPKQKQFVVLSSSQNTKENNNKSLGPSRDDKLFSLGGKPVILGTDGGGA